MTSAAAEEGVEASDQAGSGRRCPGIAHSDSGTGESALQVSPSCWEAIVVEMSLKYGANYIFKQQPKPLPLVLFWNHTKQAVEFLSGPPSATPGRGG